MRLNPVYRYSALSKCLHWIIALAVIMMLCVGFLLDSIPDEFQATAYMLHKSTGITILCLMLFRIIWIHVKGRPDLPDSVRLWEKILSRVVQYALYLFLILMPLSGWIMSVAANKIPVYYGWFALPLPFINPNKPLAHLMVDVHNSMAWILLALLSLHIAGALKHHFLDKDNVLKRMWIEK